jgi:hypothetical protein
VLTIWLVVNHHNRQRDQHKMAWKQ